MHHCLMGAISSANLVLDARPEISRPHVFRLANRMDGAVILFAWNNGLTGIGVLWLMILTDAETSAVATRASSAINRAAVGHTGRGTADGGTGYGLRH